MTLVERFPGLRLRQTHYVLAVLFVALSALVFFISAQVLSAPYLVSFMVGVGASAIFGVGPGLLAALLATLASDFFFIPPLMQFNFDHLTLLAAANYALAAIVARTGATMVRRTIGSSVLFETFVVGSKTDSQVGRVDGAINGEIFGWAIDQSQPSVPPKINVYVDSRPVGELLPVWYRRDIGHHAFYFDLTSVAVGGRTARVDVEFSNSQRLVNSPLKINIPVRSRPESSEAVLFMHIPKTAGTAFREAIIANYRPSEVAYLYPDPPGYLLAGLDDLPLSQREKLRFVIGHFRFGVHTMLPQESSYVTIVRDPIRRVISQYLYLLPELETAPEELARLIVEMLENRQTVNLDNLMVRYFGGVADDDFPPGSIDRSIYDVAVHNLCTKFQFVGHQEYANEAYARLRPQFHWKARPSLDVVNKGRIADLEAFEPVREAIRRFNRWDCQLYAEILRLFPIASA